MHGVAWIGVENMMDMWEINLQSHKSQVIENVLCCFKKFGYQAMSSN